MADEKLTQLTSLDAFATGDLLYVVDDPAGTPVSKKATIQQVQDYVEGAANTFTAKQTIDLSGEQLALGGTNTGVMSFAGSSSGKVTVQAASAAGTYTLTLPTSDGDSGQFLQTDGSGVLSWDDAPATSPAGSDTQLQFNDAGSFGGDAGLTFDKTSNALTIGAGSLKMTGSSSGTVTLQPAAAAGTYSLTLPTTDGDAGQFLKTDGSGVLSWDAPAVVTPGGSDTQVQFNDGGAFGADSGFTFNKTAKTLTLGGATVTASSPVLDLSQTWDNGAVTFTGLKFNATDTASAAGSLLMDLQRNGASAFKIDKSINNFSLSVSASQLTITAGQTFTNLVSAFGFNIVGTTAQYSINNDVLITRRAAANWRLGNVDAAAPVAQTLSVQSVVAGTTNTAGANFTIDASQGTGSAAGGSIVLRVAPAGASGTAQNALATALTIDSTRLATFAGSVTVPAGSNSAPSIWFAGASTTGFFASFTNAISAAVSGTNSFQIASTGVQVNSGMFIGFNSNSSISSATDTTLYRDAANTLALRNGTNAQTFRVYNTFTSATNFERANIFWDSNVLKIGTEKGSAGGTARALELQTDGTTRLTIGTTGAAFNDTVASGVALAVTAQNAAGREVIFRGRVATSGNSVFNIYNGTSSDSVFIPAFAGYFDTLSSRESLAFNGLVSSSTDGSNSSAMGIISFTAARTDSSSDPINGNFTDIQNRNIFSVAYKAGVSSEADLSILVKAGGRVWFPPGFIALGSGTTSSFPALKRSSTSIIVRLADDSANAPLESASLKTDAPTGGTSGTWKLGVRVAATTLLDATQYIEVDIGGTLYKVALVTT
jgi:hypothetical protein